MKKHIAILLSLAAAVSCSVPAAGAAVAGAHPVGTNISTSDGTVWMVAGDGTRRAYTSVGAFFSFGYNNFNSVVPANSADLSLPTGQFIPPQDGKIICSDRGSDKGTCYLISDSKKAAFTSAGVFQQLGFSFSNALYGDVSFLGSLPDISSGSSAHLPGTLVNNSGTIQLVGFNGMLGIPSMDTLNSWGYKLTDIVPANAADKAMAQTYVMGTHNPGDLNEDQIIRNNGSSSTNTPSNPTTPNSPTTPTNPSVTPGTLSIALDPNVPSPAATQLLIGSTQQTLAQFVLSAGSTEAVKLQSIAISHSGASTDIGNVTMYLNGSQACGSPLLTLSNSYTFFISTCPLTIPAGGTANVSIRGDVLASAAAGDSHSISVSAASSVTAIGALSGATISPAGTFPITSRSFATARTIVTLSKDTVLPASPNYNTQTVGVLNVTNSNQLNQPVTFLPDCHTLGNNASPLSLTISSTFAVSGRTIAFQMYDSNNASIPVMAGYIVPGTQSTGSSTTPNTWQGTLTFSCSSSGTQTAAFAPGNSANNWTPTVNPASWTPQTIAANSSKKYIFTFDTSDFKPSDTFQMSVASGNWYDGTAVVSLSNASGWPIGFSQLKY